MSELELGKYDYYVDVVLPLALEQSYSYRVPVHMIEQVKVGSRIVVPFQKASKLYTAIVVRLYQSTPKPYESKYLISVLDDEPIVYQEHLDLWQWMASYYMCQTGDVMQAALPAALKLSSETKIKLLNPEQSLADLDDKEFLIVEALQMQAQLSIQDVQKILDQKSILPFIREMIAKGILEIEEELEERYTPKTEKFIGIAEQYLESGMLASLFAELEKRPKQLDVLQVLLQAHKTGKKTSYKQLIKEYGLSISSIQTLVKNEILFSYETEVSRLHEQDHQEIQSYILSDEQEQAEQLISQAAHELKPVLLHGVTASGKTLLYIRQIEKCIAEGKQALVMVPEIGLTTALVERYKKYFSEDVVVYHSRYSDNERAEIWRSVLAGKTKIILGTRSSILLPFLQLGLVIVDEEHDPSYKQQDPAPRYHARDVSLYLARQKKIPIILGSATPSVESYFNAQAGKYKLVQLTQRYGGVELPDIQIANMQHEFMAKSGGVFGRSLLQAIEESLRKKEQIILFQNRRGYAPFVQCNVCGFTPHCQNCDISLSYHKFKDKLRCHYCGFEQKLIQQCSACGSTQIEMKGLGTEKIEDELKTHFPEARIARMDLDTTRKKRAYLDLLRDFEDGEIDILVGTQMVTKGLDFSNLLLVGIIQTDHLLFMPEFRAHERAYQLIEQVAGRAGRRNRQGKVILQSFQPEHPIIQMASQHQYLQFIKQQISERKQFDYPPYKRLIEIELKHAEQAVVLRAAALLAKELKQYVSQESLLGPETPLVSRIRNLYLQKIMLKIDVKKLNLEELKKAIRHAIKNVQVQKELMRVRIVCNVDPY